MTTRGLSAARNDPRIPGPPRTSTLAVLARMMRSRLDVMTWAAAEYGDAVRLPLGPKTLYFFNHPDHAKHVLADNAGNYTKGLGMVHARRALGDGLLTSEGELWRRQRKTIQPVFQARRIAAQLGAIADEAEQLTARLRSHGGRGRVDLREEMTAFTLGVLGRTLVDADLGMFESIAGSFEAVQDQAMFDAITLGAVPLWLPLPRQVRFRRARRDLQRIVDTLAAARAAKPAGDDVVSRLIESIRREPDRHAGRIRMRDELVTLLLAGHETTASTLTWALHLLDEHPEAWRRLHDEAVEVFGRGPLTIESLHGLTYTTQVLEETLRLYPPVWLLPRIARADDEIGGFPVPAGADVLLCPYLLHRHPAFWTSPLRFDPERFTPSASAGRNRYSYIPFGAGPRFCVGNSLGMMEATVALATVARDLRLTKVPGYRVTGEAMLTLQIRGGLPVTVRPAN
ncbi:cytochrome P450 [Microbispora sp. NBC_01389]|uniref:cytochrome P450 n=1 Tax=Microbispora sp. NBC_01389 TaxID=2903584 RepID=UPI0032505152